jgi:DNA-directed RNA polymerase subunit RPC12/RpoP
MITSITCPVCGAKYDVPESRMGRKITCANCLSQFSAGSSGAANPSPEAAPGPTPSADRPPVQAPPPVRTPLARPEELIRFRCPRCGKSLESSADLSGQKVNCTGCGQRLQIPSPPTPPTPALNKTVLGAVEGQPPQPTAFATQPAPPPAREEVAHTVELVHEAPRRDNCLECGRDVTGRDQSLTCPDCGSRFCSSACYRQHHYYAHEARRPEPRPEPRPGFQCPFCGSRELPYRSETISGAGWAVFVIMLLFCFPLFWIGLLIKESTSRCANCGARIY